MLPATESTAISWLVIMTKSSDGASLGVVTPTKVVSSNSVFWAESRKNSAAMETERLLTLRNDRREITGMSACPIGDHTAVSFRIVLFGRGRGMFNG